MSERKRLPRILQLRAERVLGYPLANVYGTDLFSVIEAERADGKGSKVYVNLQTREELTVDEFKTLSEKNQTITPLPVVTAPTFDALITRKDVNNTPTSEKVSKKLKTKKSKSTNVKKLK